MIIKYLKKSEIDRKRWDEALAGCRNSLIYASSWYLDVVCSDWEALVGGDYEYIMPLPLKRKFGLTYLIQPLFTQQLGLFSAKEIDAALVRQFIQKIPFASYAINLNESNYCIKSVPQPNYLLNLNNSAGYLKSRFSKNSKRNILRAQKSDVQIFWKSNEIDDFMDFVINENHQHVFNIDMLKEILVVLAKRQRVNFIFAKNSLHTTIAALAVLISDNRLIYWVPVSNREGKEKSAMFLIVDELIEKFANSDVVLDFEGSKIEGIARFYKGFGAEHINYYFIRKNRPEWLLKMKNIIYH